MKSKILLFLFFAGVIAYIVLVHRGGQKTLSNNISFHAKLSNYNLFHGDMAQLKPAAGVEIYELASPLFTDYAEKQRLIKLPAGKQIRATGNALPEFPEGTLLAKTFYYTQAEKNQRRLIETRLLILKNGIWNAATYQWSANQEDAALIENGADVPVDFSSEDGKHRKITYKIPSQRDCGSCHRSDDQLIPVGPKLNNLNISMTRNGKTQNQLVYLEEKGMLNNHYTGKPATLPDYRDVSQPVDKRARAYFAINCAHCHQPSGMAGSSTLNLDYSIDYEHTGIQFNKKNILERTAAMGQYHMPKIGTTVIHDEGVALIRQYIQSLQKN